MKWSRDRLDDYVLLSRPARIHVTTGVRLCEPLLANEKRSSSGWEIPASDQHALSQEPWSYIWLDWTCIPQDLRGPAEETHSTRDLESMPAIIRNSSFMYWHPPFEPKLWISYEIAEYSLTNDYGSPTSDDIKPFKEHIAEMLRVGVRPTLEQHGYRCSYDRDRKYLTAWLELLVLWSKLQVDVGYRRRLSDCLTWCGAAETMVIGTGTGSLELLKFEGILKVDEKSYSFTPFPQWASSLLHTHAQDHLC
jgi:hypothetical protein